jgi:hypothetical protein
MNLDFYTGQSRISFPACWKRVEAVLPIYLTGRHASQCGSIADKAMRYTLGLGSRRSSKDSSGISASPSLPTEAWIQV